MLGGKIKRSKAADSVWVQRTEEVIAGDNGKIPLPKDHLNTSATLTPKAFPNHPIRFINYGGGVASEGFNSAGTRTQIVTDATAGVAMTANTVLTFNNTAAGVSEQKAAKGDRVRIFWEEEVVQDDSAIEVVISPETFP